MIGAQKLCKKIFSVLFFLSPLFIFCYCSLNARSETRGFDSSPFIAPPKLVFDSCYTQRQSSFQAGNGSAASPYAICNFMQLKNIYRNLNAHYILAQDINASRTMRKAYNQGRGWEPISPFHGNFNGKGFAIYNLYLRHENAGSSVFSGFFGKLSKGARVSNLGIKNINIAITFPEDPQAKSILAGCLAASSDRAKVSNSYAQGKIMVRSLTKNLRAELGGLIGYQDNGNISQSYADCDIQLNSLARQGSTNVGGLTGLNAGRFSIEKSYASGELTIKTRNVHNVGALVGTNISGKESFKGANYYLSAKVKKALGSGVCSSSNCIELKRDNLENMNETRAPLDWDTSVWLARSGGLACLKNAGPYRQSCP